MAIDTMKASLTNPKRDIKLYNLLEVTSTNSFVSSTTMLDPEGLFSEEIFGRQGTPERKTKWGYMNLHAVMMNPHAFFVFSKLKRNIANQFKEGIGRYYVDSEGELQFIDITKQTVPETALVKEPGTGFKWLKEHWDKISWKTTKSMSSTAKTLRNFLKTCDIDQIFWEQMLIMPAFYRDIDATSNKRNMINNYYNSILRQAKIIKSTGNIVDIFNDPTMSCVTSAHIKLQDQLNEFYKYFMEKICGTHGFANEYVLGKHTDYGARLVISPPDYNINHYKEAEADFFHSSTPLNVAINIFAPFIIHAMVEFIRMFVSGRQDVTYWDVKTKSYIKSSLDPTYMTEFTPEGIRKIIDNYKNSKEYRLRPVTLKGENGKRIPVTIYYNTPNNRSTNNLEVRNIEPDDMINHIKYLIWCELFYILAEDTLKEKTIFNTRYPLTTYNNTFCSLMNIIPTNFYEKIIFNGIEYPRFPLLNVKSMKDVDGLFTDTMRMCSVYLSAMGADYDGDQISTQGLFSNEGNKESLERMKSPSNVVGISGESIRSFPHVINHGIYGLTYKTKKPVKS